MIYRAAITAKVYIRFRAAFAAKNIKSNSKAYIDRLRSQNMLNMSKQISFYYFYGWPAGEMRIKAKPQASEAVLGLGLSLAKKNGQKSFGARFIFCETQKFGKQNFLIKKTCLFKKFG